MIDHSQNNQSMTRGRIIKRVRFNLESNRTIYFNKHTRIKLSLSRMPTIEDNFCRWGDIDPRKENRVSSVMPRMPRKYNNDILLSPVKKGKLLSVPRLPVRRRSSELKQGQFTMRRWSRQESSSKNTMLVQPASSSTKLKDAVKTDNSLQKSVHAAPQGILLQESQRDGADLCCSGLA
jgi:hypothetical protein